jgi:phosphatidylinositol glycan class O
MTRLPHRHTLRFSWLTRRRHQIIAIIALIGIYRFSASFFLAKKALTQTSTCDATSASLLLSSALGLSNLEIQFLYDWGLLASHTQSQSSTGCWMPRRVDAVAVIVVDALRFDFALESLPLSIGSRLPSHDGTSQLFQFIADPPTVTMQRIKGMTTGGLPTFMDISGNLGGATIDEDSWVDQLYKVSSLKRWGTAKNLIQQYLNPNTKVNKMAFVGDDTWIDLFPVQFDDKYPYPSFNTRDLDTVDNGVLFHFPFFLAHFGSNTLSTYSSHDGNQNNTSTSSPYFYEVLVAHFLGVDHVGHTFGPHNQHMSDKLHQIDQALAILLSHIDEAATTCQVAFIFGDHGMTEDGNHGGGTMDETHAALFAHYSPGCGDMTTSLDIPSSVDRDGFRGLNSALFQSIHQMDLVPTISLLLGLPIPFSNLGGVVPSLLPPHSRMDNVEPLSKSDTRAYANDLSVETPSTTIALALNAAQVWNYLTTYSTRSHSLPPRDLLELKSILDEATMNFREGISHGPSASDDLAYRKACGLYKYFLLEAANLGQRVWTRFDVSGMIVGIILLCLALILQIRVLVEEAMFRNSETSLETCINNIIPIKVMITRLSNIGIMLLPNNKIIPILLISVIMTFDSFLLPFGNSYILAEKEINAFAFGLLGLLASCTLQQKHHTDIKARRISRRRLAAHSFLLIILSRFHGLYISGHGKDPTIRQHLAHSTPVFLSSVLMAAIIRFRCLLQPVCPREAISIPVFHDSWWKTGMDIASLGCLAFSWIEKRSIDMSRNGYLCTRIAFLIYFSRLFQLAWSAATAKKICVNSIYHFLGIFSLLVVTVTGPSAASSLVFFYFQVQSLHYLTKHSDTRSSISYSSLLASLWKLSIRNAFFSTGHACSFSQLQVSAAFVATDKFHYTTAGTWLFLNTFGWEIVGSVLCFVSCQSSDAFNVWSWLFFYQLYEAFASCVSVSILRRHLMVWAVFAPRFMFENVSFVISCLLWLTTTSSF